MNFALTCADTAIDGHKLLSAVQNQAVPSRRHTATGVQVGKHIIADVLSVRWGGKSCGNAAAAVTADATAGCEGASQSAVLGNIRSIAALQRVRANEAEYLLTGQPSAARSKHIRLVPPHDCPCCHAHHNPCSLMLLRCAEGERPLRRAPTVSKSLWNCLRPAWPPSWLPSVLTGTRQRH